LALICSIRIHSQEIRRLSAFSPPYFLRPEAATQIFYRTQKTSDTAECYVQYAQKLFENIL
jgi:hypothetical protein